MKEDLEVKDVAASVLGLDAFDTVAAANEGAKMEVRNPTSGEVLRWPDGRPWTITYVGKDSKKIEDVALQQNDRRAQAMFRTRTPVLSAVVALDSLELLVAATKEWDIPLGDGSPAANDPKEYRVAYKKYKWLFEQGDQFTDSRANFPLKGSATP